MRTIVGVNDPKAVKRFSGMLAVDVARDSYFNRKFVSAGEHPKTPIQRIDELESEAGDRVTYDLSLQLRGQPTEGDDQLAGNEEDLKFATDELLIDQMRHGVNAGGKMTRKRTLHNLRLVAKARLSEWWSRIFDEMFFMYLSGARGINSDYIFPTSYVGFAGNAFSAPDASHILYGGDASSKATIGTNDGFTLSLIDKASVKAKMLGGGSQQIPAIQPIMIDGEERFVVLMSPHQAYDVRTNSSTGQWLDIQKAAAGAQGQNNPIFKGSLGMYNNHILHEHKAVVRFNDYGGASVDAGRALYLGRQAAVCAFGSSGNRMSFDWFEDTDDRGNVLVVDSGSIFGVKKCSFNVNGTTYDFGVMALDTWINTALA